MSHNPNGVPFRFVPTSWIHARVHIQRPVVNRISDRRVDLDEQRHWAIAQLTSRQQNLRAWRILDTRVDLTVAGDARNNELTRKFQKCIYGQSADFIRRVRLLVVVRSVFQAYGLVDETQQDFLRGLRHAMRTREPFEKKNRAKPPPCTGSSKRSAFDRYHQRVIGDHIRPMGPRLSTVNHPRAVCYQIA